MPLFRQPSKLLLSWMLLLLALAGPSQLARGSTGVKSQCRSLCTACQSLRPDRINQICSHSLLHGCSCPEYALNLTFAKSTAALQAGPHGNCPTGKSATEMGFCPYGHQTDSTGCPVATCRLPPSCPAASDTSTAAGNNNNNNNKTRTHLLPANCRTHCPAGYQTDASGCPICRCRCDFADADASLDSRCAVACAAVGAAHQLLPPPPGSSDAAGNCPVCLCLRGPQPVAAAGVAKATEKSTPTSPPLLRRQQRPCLLRCPNSCGEHGYAQAEARDERGCVLDCSCACPPTEQACPTKRQRCLRWELDRFGCQVCAACSSSGCVTMASAAAGTDGEQDSSALIDRLCRSLDCSAKAFELAQNDQGCLVCRCAGDNKNSALVHATTSSSSSSGTKLPLACPNEPAGRCSQRDCGPHRLLRDVRGCLSPDCRCACPPVDFAACLKDCTARRGNVSVAKDSYGCYGCDCVEPPPPPPPRCPLAREFLRRCGSSVAACGPHGFESDPASGCQLSCRCSCPKRHCSPCFYGNRRDAYGCEMCECVSAVEYLQFLPF